MWHVETPLHPCPFCGSTQIRALDVAGGIGLLQCQTCQAQGPLGQTHDLAVQGWQTRGRPVPSPCLHCGTIFQPRVQRQKYCHATCKAAILRRERQEERRIRRLVFQQEARAIQQDQQREQRHQAREARRVEKAAAVMQQHWLLASS